MKITIERNALLKSLNHVQSVVERRNTIPVLSNVLMHAERGFLSLTATDLDIEVVESITVDVARSGAATAPAHTLYDIVRKLPDGSQIEMSYGEEEERLVLRAGRSRFALQSLPKEDFPAMYSGDLVHKFEIPTDALIRLIDKTRFAVSTEETRYYLNGIYLHPVEDIPVPVLRAVATDGHRLAQVDYPLPGEGAAGMPGVIVPRKTVQELQKLLEDGEGIVQVGVSSTKIRFERDTIVLTSKLIDGTFPDYDRVIPKENDKILHVQGKVFSEAVDRVSTVSAEKSRAVKINLEDGRMVLTANNPEAGSATEELAVSYSTEPMEIGFNARYLLEIAGQFEGEKAVFQMADSGSPTLIRDEDDENALYVLMPMRV